MCPVLPFLSGELDLDLKWVRLVTNGTNPEIFSDQILFINGTNPGFFSQILNLIWKKNPEFVQFEASLTKLVPKPNIHAPFVYRWSDTVKTTRRSDLTDIGPQNRTNLGIIISFFLRPTFFLSGRDFSSRIFSPFYTNLNLTQFWV